MKLNDTRKALNFDLDTNKLKEHFSDYSLGYNKLRSALLKFGFEHKQGSGYVSKLPVKFNTAVKYLNRVIMQNAWIKSCVKEFDITEIGDTYELADYIRKYKSIKKEPKAKEEEELELE